MFQYDILDLIPGINNDFTKSFYEHLLKHDISFTGVPDSLLKTYVFIYLIAKKKHIIAANEGITVALAIGYYLSSNKVPMIYLQIQVRKYY